jgi:RNA polymerase sigma factor (sigma-70 family)
MRTSNAVRRILRNKPSLLSREEEGLLLSDRDNPKVIDLLLWANMGLVTSIANKYKHIGYPMEDLIGAGVQGLLKAISRHDASTKLSTYAYPWIRKFILEEIEQNHRTIRLPSHIHETMCKVNKSIGSGNTSLSEICSDTGLPLERIVKAMTAYSVHTGEYKEEMDKLTVDPDDTLSADLQEALDALTPDQSDCLLYVLGLSEERPPYTDDMVARFYNDAIIRLKERLL